MTGIMHGMVMNRNRQDVCDIQVQSASALSFVEYCSAEITGQAKITPTEKPGIYRLTGIPVGGPYTVTIEDETFGDIYVGDVWLLAGQSNMQGVGWYTAEDSAFEGDEDVRAFYMDDHWGPAHHPLHDVWHAVDQVHTKELVGKAIESKYQGVGPGVAFAKRMRELTGVPQGIICCAHGGTSLSEWSPDLCELGSNKSLYAAMRRRYIVNGSSANGMFWYQGCQDAFDCASGVFEEKMLHFLDRFREDFNSIPVLQVQLACVTHYDFPGLMENWTHIREIQRTLPEKAKGIYTISAIDKTYDDAIHLSSAAQKQLGIQAAETMYSICFKQADDNCMLTPVLDSVKIQENSLSGCVDLCITWKNIVGGLQAMGRPHGFSLNRYPDKDDTDEVFDVRLIGDTVIVRTSCTIEEVKQRSLYYGFGTHPYCNITDGRGIALPGFGPIILK